MEGDDPANLIALAAPIIKRLRECGFDFVIIPDASIKQKLQNSGNGGGNVNTEETRLGKRKEQGSGGVEEAECMDENENSNPKKKARFVWTPDLHDKFVSAVAQLGINAYPNQILELMNVEGLTRQIVASHLQRYRLSQKKLNTKGATEPAKENWKTSPSVVGSTHVKPRGIPSLDDYVALMENWTTQRRSKLPVSSCSGESQGWQLNSNVPDEAVGLRLDDNVNAYMDILVGYTTDTSLPILDDSWLRDLDHYFPI